jgi:hypothetical protein
MNLTQDKENPLISNPWAKQEGVTLIPKKKEYFFNLYEQSIRLWISFFILSVSGAGENYFNPSRLTCQTMEPTKVPLSQVLKSSHKRAHSKLCHSCEGRSSLAPGDNVKAEAIICIKFFFENTNCIISLFHKFSEITFSYYY